jgi:Cu-Zn family superoxide dismutase
MRKFGFRAVLIAVAVSMFVLAIASKASFAENSPSMTAKATVVDAVVRPDIAGKLQLKQISNGVVLLDLSLKGDPKVLTPGLHGVHFHETAICDEGAQPRFSTAGGHFDPGPKGSSLPVEFNHPYHLGDLPNIEINRKGEGRLLTATSRVTLYNSPVSLFDKDGSALIIHQNPDAIKSGGTAAEAGGPRLACGVIEHS